jgi:protein TonB
MNTFQPPHKGPPKKKRDYKVAAIVAVAVLGAAAGIAQVIKGDATPRKRVMETVALRLVPPPPPPPKAPPPPPPPKLVEKQKIEPPQDRPQAPKPVDAPPPAPLALDAKGGAGSDGFGLGGKLGGADYTAGGGSPYGHYGSVVSMAIKRRLAEDEKVAHAKFHGELKVWFTAAGAIAKVALLHGTGDSELDVRIQQIVASMPAVAEAPPANMPAAIFSINGQT